MKVCEKCGFSESSDDALFCKSCGNKFSLKSNDTNDKLNSNNSDDEFDYSTNEQDLNISGGKLNISNNNFHSKHSNDKEYSKSKKSKTPFIILAVLLVILSISVLSKDKILYEYYLSKAHSEVLSSNSINYYIKALDFKYEPILIDEIDKILFNDPDAEDSILSLKNHLTENDFNKLATNVYVKCAEESFSNNDYETTLIYLNKAIDCGFIETSFKYYDKLSSDEDNSNSDDTNSTTNYNYTTNYNNSDNYYPNTYVSSSSNYIIYDSNSRYLSASELSYYTSEELGYIRNEIFARHGYVFNKSKYNNYFSSKSWYYPDYSYSGNLSTLNSYESYNVELIKSLE